jgi:predicted TIM-barrel fold metal-dependent hydrolase
MQPEGSSGEHVLVASSDTHIGPPMELLRDYCERAYLEEFDAFAANCNVVPGAVTTADVDVEKDEIPFDWSQVITPGHYDVDERLRQMNADGVAAEVIYHGSQNGHSLPFVPRTGSFALAGDGEDRRTQELYAAGMRIYNRWLADFCSVEPTRHVGLAYLPLWDLNLAIEELEWAREAGLRGVNLPAPRPSLPDYNDPIWDPFWSACDTHAMPLNTHHTGQRGPATLGLARYEGRGGDRALTIETMYFSARGLMWLIYGGVFERHPSLKFVLTEVFGLSAWLPLTLLQLDELAQETIMMDFDPIELSKRPSEFFRSNCFIGASFMSHADARSAVEHGLVGNYLWGSDYPHREGTYPWSKDSLRATMADIPPGDIRSMAGENLVDVFGLDLGELQTIADRIGPTMDELTKPLTAAEMPVAPGRIEYSFGFRERLFF